VTEPGGELRDHAAQPVAEPSERLAGERGRNPAVNASATAPATAAIYVRVAPSEIALRPASS
jgi:hypothetical protein